MTEHRIEVEPQRVMIVRVDEKARTIELELPGNYDRLGTTYLVSDGTVNIGGRRVNGWTKKGKVLGTVLRVRRNTRRVGSPRGTRTAAAS